MPEDHNTDLERCVTASSKQGTSYQPSLSANAGRRCKIAVQHLDGRAILINATVEEVDGDLVFSSAKQQISQALAKSWHQRLIGRLLMGLVVGTARIKQIMHCSPQPPSPGHEGSPTLPHRVYLEDFTPDPLLTEALHNPHFILSGAAYPFHVDSLGYPPGIDIDAKSTSTHLERIDSESTTTCIEDLDRDIIVVKRVLDRTKVARLLILLLLFSPALGIVVGVCSHNAEVGIAASAGVFALASFVQGLVAWIQG